MSDFKNRLGQTDREMKNKVFKYSYIAIALFFLYSAFNGTYGIQRIIKLNLEKSTLIESNQEELTKVIDAVRLQELYESDKGYLEYLARTQYHMVYPGETIYRYYGQ